MGGVGGSVCCIRIPTRHVRLLGLSDEDDYAERKTEQNEKADEEFEKCFGEVAPHGFIVSPFEYQQNRSNEPGPSVRG